MLAALGVVQPAVAQNVSPPDGAQGAVQISAETRDLGGDRGTLNSLTIEYKIKHDDTTVIVGPILGEIRGRFESASAAGVDATIYQRFGRGFSSRTSISLAEGGLVFAHFDLGQDLTFAIAPATTATLGARWVEYGGDHNVLFLSAGVRRYFEGGSVAYRVSYVEPDGRAPIAAHLVNLTLNDEQGQGKTQVWLSAGSTSLETEVADDFAGENYAVFFRRVQPVNNAVNITGSLGAASYDRPSGRVTGATFGLGVEVELE